MTIYSTIWSSDPEYNRAVEVLDWRELGWGGLLRRVSGLCSGDILIANGALGAAERWRDLLLAAVGVRHRRNIGLVVSDATWDPRSTRQDSAFPILWGLNRALTRRLLLSTLTENTVICFLSRSEAVDFLADVPGTSSHALFTPFFASPVLTPARPSRGPYIFSGGDSLRDWPLLMDALGTAPIPVVVATRYPDRCSWPGNFEAISVPHAEFHRLAAGATVGVLALRTDVRRSVGQQTYLNLLSYGVPVVVNDAPGVYDHLSGIEAARIVPARDARAMRAAALGLADIDPSSRVALEATAKVVIDRRFSSRAYLRTLVAIATKLSLAMRTPPAAGCS